MSKYCANCDTLNSDSECDAFTSDTAAPVNAGNIDYSCYYDIDLGCPGAAYHVLLSGSEICYPMLDESCMND